MQILQEIKSCDLCTDVLPFAPKPILQISSAARILLIGQAPGLAAHTSGVPWNDASGKRLREWLKLDNSVFYSAAIAIVPMGFCYPGKAKSGDLPPRPECQTRWMDSVLCDLPAVRLKILIGTYALRFFFPTSSLNELIWVHARSESEFIVLPHPSPRNNIWLAREDWFEKKALKLIQKKIQHAMIS
jgi:uracil-DNA glycosylase